MDPGDERTGPQTHDPALTNTYSQSEHNGDGGQFLKGDRLAEFRVFQDGMRRRARLEQRLPVLDCGCADPLSYRHRTDRCRWCT